MKKFFVLMLSVAFLAAFAIGPVCAAKPFQVRAVFESDIVSEAGAGVFGEVWIRTGGQFKVELKGVEADTTFDVVLKCEAGDTDLGDIITDAEGEGKLTGTLTLPFFCSQPILEITDGNGASYFSGFDLAL